MHLDLPCWEDLWRRLKNIEALLSKKYRVQRFLATCLPDNVQPPAALEHWSRRLYEERWGCVVEFIDALYPLLDFLKACWSATKYSHGVDSADGSQQDQQFSAALLTETLMSAGFKLKVFTLLQVEKDVQALAGWAEACPCHGDLLSCTSRYVSECFFAESLGTKSHTLGVTGRKSCPLSSCRAPELAGGELASFFAKMSQSGEMSLFSSAEAAEASETAKREASLIFRHCRSRIKFFLTLKLSHWQRLPHLLCGLAHFNESKARECATKAWEQWQANAVPEVHHPLTLRFCCDLAEDLQRFIHGVPLKTLTKEFQLEVAKLLFVPVTERSIERKHSLVRGALHRSGLKGSTVRVSFANRLPELQQKLEEKPNLFETLIACFERARTHSRLPAELGLEGHPLLESLPLKNSSDYTKILRAVLYRADVHSHSVSLVQQQSQHLQAITQVRKMPFVIEAERAAEALAPPDGASSCWIAHRVKETSLMLQHCAVARNKRLEKPLAFNFCQNKVWRYCFGFHEWRCGLCCHVVLWAVVALK